jgi:hypothetical protein
LSKSCQKFSKVVKKLSNSCQKVVTKSCHHRSSNPKLEKPENLKEKEKKKKRPRMDDEEPRMADKETRHP